MLLLQLLFSPILWALGFVMPLFAQVLLATGLAASNTTAYTIGGAIALGWGIYAQVRGRWV